MRLSILNVASVILVFAFSQEGIANFQAVRCEVTGDSLATAEQAAGRRAWASKCLPALRGQIKHNASLKEANGEMRPGYPTLMFMPDEGDASNPSNWFAPTDGNAPCSFPQGYNIVGYCTAGCYTPEQSLWFMDGYRAIGDAKDENLQEIMTLSSSSEFGLLRFEVSLIDYFITDLVDGTHTVLNFHTLSGGALRVTENHPLVDSQGQMRAAESLNLGDALVTKEGRFDPIVSIISEQYYGKVLNLEVRNKNIAEKVVVAQGYLNGTVYYQNEGIKDLNRVILRTNLITDQMVR